MEEAPPASRLGKRARAYTADRSRPVSVSTSSSAARPYRELVLGPGSRASASRSRRPGRTPELERIREGDMRSPKCWFPGLPHQACQARRLSSGAATVLIRQGVHLYFRDSRMQKRRTGHPAGAPGHRLAHAGNLGSVGSCFALKRLRSSSRPWSGAPQCATPALAPLSVGL